jgi:hypothetical protein
MPTSHANKRQRRIPTIAACLNFILHEQFTALTSAKWHLADVDVLADARLAPKSGRYLTNAADTSRCQAGDISGKLGGV